MVIGAHGEDLEGNREEGGKAARRQEDSKTGMSSPDVLHSLFSVKVKYCQRLPLLLSVGMTQARRAAEGKIPSSF